MRQPRIISPLQSKTPKCRNVAIVIRMNHRMRMIPQTIRRPWNSRSTIHSIFLFDVYLRLCLKNHAANPLGISLKVVFGSIGCVLLHFLSISMSDIQRKSSVEHVSRILSCLMEKFTMHHVSLSHFRQYCSQIDMMSDKLT